MHTIFILLSIILTATLGLLFPAALLWIIVFGVTGLLYTLWRMRSQGYQPQSKTYKTLEKLKKRRQKTAQHKHQHISDQIAYIGSYWGYTKEQEKVTARFIEKRAYSELYNKLTASLIPQIITLIDNCNAQSQKGCKREVSKRIRELTDVMKKELKKKKSKSDESFETTLEVYDHLVKEVKA